MTDEQRERVRAYLWERRLQEDDDPPTEAAIAQEMAWMGGAERGAADRLV